MSEANAMSRRHMLGVAGTTSLAVLAAGTLPARAEEKDKYPVLHKAIKEMKEAIKELDKGRKIFGGHRVKAMKAMKDAIDECEAAIKFAEENKDKG